MKTPLRTTEQIRALAAPVQGQALYWDSGDGALPGFGVRVTANGKKAYVVQARVAGQTRRVVIGPCTMALKAARKLAQDRHNTLSVHQVDITAEKRAEAAATRAKKAEAKARSMTLREVMETYLREHTVKNQPLKDSSKRDIRRHVEGNNFGDWADQPVQSITRPAVVKRFAELSARAPQQAKQAMSILRALLNFPKDDEYNPIIPINPVGALRGKMTQPEGRERMVPLPKVRAVWAMLQEARAAELDATSPTRTALDLVCFGLLTGCRLGEAQNLTFDLINLEEGWWRITAETAKDRRARILPLCPAAVELLRQREPRRGNPYVFPSRTLAGRTFFKDPRGALAKVSMVAGLHLSFHDLRRTWLGVSDECRVERWRGELLTSHVPTSITGRHYAQRYDLRHLAADAATVGDWMIDKVSNSNGA